MLVKQIIAHKRRYLLTMISLWMSLTLVFSVDFIQYNLKSAIEEQMNAMALEVNYLTCFDKLNQDVLQKVAASSKAFLRYFYKDYKGFQLVGIDERLDNLFQIEANGRLITASDYRLNDNVVCLGRRAYDYFECPKINDYIYIDGIAFRFIGLVETKLDNVFVDVENAIYIPLDYIDQQAIQSYYFISDSFDESVLTRDSDYLLLQQKSTKEGFEIVIRFLNKLLSFLTLFSFVIACIGMLNNNLMNLKIKVKEIGLKRTLGCSQKEIFMEVLIEQFVITFFAVIAAFMFVLLLKLFINDLQIKLGMIFKKLASVVMISSSCGFISAYQASKITIAEALKQ